MSDAPDQQSDQLPEIPLRAGEAETLRSFLAFYRAVLRRKAAGLSAAQLAAQLAPSDLTLGGMLKHLALVEDNWFRIVLLGLPEREPWASVDWGADRDWDWHSATQDSPADLLALYDRAIADAEEITDRVLAAPDGLETLSARPDRRSGEPFSLRWILVHLIEEYARHTGHADLIRQAIDGATGD